MKKKPDSYKSTIPVLKAESIKDALFQKGRVDYRRFVEVNGALFMRDEVGKEVHLRYIGGEAVWEEEWRTEVKFDASYNFKPYTLSGPETWTANLENAGTSMGEIRTVTGDGSTITLDGPFSMHSITIPDGETKAIVMSWTGNQIIVVLHDVDTIDDMVPPALSGAEVGTIDNKTMVLTFDKDCDQSATPQNSAFSFEDIATNPSVASQVWNSARELYLTLSDNVAEGESPKVSYTKPGATGNPIKDLSGNETESWTSYLVDNNASAWSPADLGAKLLDWWDGTIVEVDGSDDITKWADQKGSIDWEPGTAPHYDATNKKIDFDNTNSEYLQSDANVGNINRSTGQYWIAFNYVDGTSQVFICKSTSAQDGAYFMIQILDNGRMRVIANKESGQTTFGWELNELLSPGKHVASIKWDGANFTIKVDNVTMEGYYAIGTVGGWENYPTVASNRLSINAWRRTADAFYDTSVYEIQRTDGTLTEQEEAENYNYLAGKY